MKARIEFYDITSEKAYTRPKETGDVIGFTIVDVQNINDLFNASRLSDIVFSAVTTDTAAGDDDKYSMLSDLYIETGAEIIDAYMNSLDSNYGEVEFAYVLELGYSSQKMRVLLFVDINIKNEYNSFLKDIVGNKLFSL